MPTVAAPSSTDRIASTIAVMGAMVLAVFLVAPRASPGVLCVLIGAIALAGGWTGGGTAFRKWSLPVVFLLAFAGWSLASAGWSGDRPESLNKALLVAAYVAAVGWAGWAVKDARPEMLRQAGRAALYAFAAAVVYLLIEELTQHGLKRLLFNVFPFMRPDKKHSVGEDEVLAVAGYISNRNMAAMMLALWPMALIAWLDLERQKRLAFVIGMAGLCAATLTLSLHETSALALLLSVAILALTFAWPKLGLSVVAAGWVIATLLVVPLASWASHGAKLQNASWLPHSARHRIVLWAYTAEQVQQRPITGIGAAATKSLDARRGPVTELMPGTPFQWRSGPHAHNIYLQVWYELGAIGAMLLCAAGLSVIAVLSRLPVSAMPFGAAAMTTAAVIGAFSWGFWQPWFLAAFGICAVLMAIAVRLARAAKPSEA